MDFLDPKKRKHHTIRLFIGYGLVAIAIALVSLILIQQTYHGYDIDKRTGKIIQNGLVFINSKPVSADVYANGEKKGNTNLRLVIPSDNYKIELKRQGYNTWSRSLYLEGGSVVQLTYPLLFPTKIIRTDTTVYKSNPT